MAVGIVRVSKHFITISAYRLFLIHSSNIAKKPLLCLPCVVRSWFYKFNPFSMFFDNSLINRAICAPSETSWSNKIVIFSISLISILSPITIGFFIIELIPKQIGCTEIGINQPFTFPIIPRWYKHQNPNGKV